MVSSGFFELTMSTAASHYARLLGANLGLGYNESSETILEILQEQPLDEIVLSNFAFYRFLYAVQPWTPLADVYSSNPYIPGHFDDLFREGRFNQVWMP